jgi:hypothetical protein
MRRQELIQLLRRLEAILLPRAPGFKRPGLNRHWHVNGAAALLLTRLTSSEKSAERHSYEPTGRAGRIRSTIAKDSALTVCNGRAAIWSNANRRETAVGKSMSSTRGRSDR